MCSDSVAIGFGALTSIEQCVWFVRLGVILGGLPYKREVRKAESSGTALYSSGLGGESILPILLINRNIFS